ncbi:RecBCD enzyme subunit RecD [Thermodesulfomicrobium sp. WS]|uniref:exodeoxyribonuclease V subunit alpha n=1 Tax=Thermodesulfomicrobium sp. WS TaxID=3004129 RepID=UPI00248F8747|nr:exodeoxyribonuclease V subunit alpha [Thermodesulfomicrobium sp. WS]BDV00573.1 RecBCD enzyme subunit RecD [Thermodesulfomicrobium sp. WS]
MLPAPELISRLAPELGFTPQDLLSAGALAHLGAPLAVALAAALLSQGARRGHTCLAEGELTARMEAISAGLAPQLTATNMPWISSQGDPAPLARSSGRLYLWRHYHHETELAKRLLHLAQCRPEVDTAWLATALPRFFPNLGSEPDFQALAALQVVRCQLTIIAGGPGTGKTTTLARALALFAAHTVHAWGKRPRILLAAPTGKAAARMREAIDRVRPTLASEIQGLIPTTASTIHRLLEMGASGTPQRDPSRPLALDLLAVDETSLMDGELAWHVVRALPEGARLVLLGDPHQLTSVEEGAVLASLTGSPDPEAVGPETTDMAHTLCGWELPALPTPAPPLAENLIALRRTYRFRQDSGIQALAQALRAGDTPRLQFILAQPWPDVTISPWRTEAELAALLGRHALPAFKPLGRLSPDAALAAIDRLRILCPMRHGPGGVEHANALLEGMLRTTSDPWFPGRLILVLANDPELDLANGDVGITLAAPGRGLRVWFAGPRSVPPAALGAVESAYATTVHKSQGSEAETVVLVLPQADHPMMSRELVYTAITRARSRLIILGDPERILQAASRRTQRSSGLGERLWQPSPYDSAQ